MKVFYRFDRFHANVRKNKWLGYFTVFLRIALAYAFLFAGFVKVNGERFTDLSNNHPLGHYLEALYHTGYYYTFIGVMQMLAGLLIVIPRTALLGALLYFPLILNIFVLSYAVRFEGSFLTAPLMVLANLYLLCWDYHRLKFILPFKRSAFKEVIPEYKDQSKKFPFKFLSGVFVTLVISISVIVAINRNIIMPRNTFSDCQSQCPDSTDPEVCASFCSCIHEDGNSLNNCLEKYGSKFSK